MVVYSVCLPLVTTAAAVRHSLVVRIYDAAGLDARERARMMDDARLALAAEHMDVVWHDCDGRAGSLHGWCADAPAPRELIVRLVRAPGPANRQVLGHAYVDPARSHGTLATVFIDRIERIAADVNADRSLVTGRVIAHEISHLVRGSVHTDAGLMKPVWTLEDLTACARAEVS
ncbi:MAG: hypothetical protein FJW14_00430 [Acidimicrobiia bacterium]|nr:hypothetical protein [Acidimicrobiia bacterium]